MREFFWFIIIAAWVGVIISITNKDYWVTAAIALTTALFIIVYGKLRGIEREQIDG